MKRLQFSLISILIISTSLVTIFSARLLWLWSDRVVQEWSYLKGARTEETRAASSQRLDAALKTTDLVIKGIGLPVTIAGGLALFLNFWVANKNIQLSQSKLMAESLSQAIQKLGEQEDVHLRIGGIYSLQRIANSSKEDHWAVMEILAAFIRNQSEAILRENERVGSLVINSVPEDIQIALTVIGRRNLEWDPLDPDKRLDLTDSFLRGAVLIQGDLRKSILLGSDLSNADFSGTNFSYAKISEIETVSNLSNATLNATNMTCASLEGAHLAKAKMARAILVQANFDHSSLKDTDFSNANVEQATFYEVEGLTLEQKESMLNWAKAYG